MTTLQAPAHECTDNPYTMTSGQVVCGRCGQPLRCDECGHTDRHLNGHDDTLDADQRAMVFGQATCWAENICAGCDPDLYRQASMASVDASDLGLHPGEWPLTVGYRGLVYGRQPGLAGLSRRLSDPSEVISATYRSGDRSLTVWND